MIDDEFIGEADLAGRLSVRQARRLRTQLKFDELLFEDDMLDALAGEDMK